MEPVATDLRERRALLATGALIVAVVVLQAPGRIIPETKLDVTIDPVGYLGRALSAWDPMGGFGRVQNQAIGYLFPMGAFSAAGHGAGVPAWLVQRLWIAAVITMGLWGAHRVARAIGISTIWGRLVAAWAYALAPATLSLAAFQSAGQLPYALVPHVLAPLLTARDGDSPRRVAARSALWVAAMGGVNGASAFAVLPLVAVWFATRRPGLDRRRLLGWWSAGAVAATLWWLIPLLVTVRYGLRFTDYTEQSSVTTLSESATEVLRGTGNWLSYLQTDAGRWLPGGWAMAADRVAIVGSVLVAGGGLLGLTRREAPGRAWLLPSLLLGATAMGIAYAGPLGGGLSHAAQHLLDGPLVPFRNVHKFAAVVRLPLAIGLGHLVSARAAASATNRHRIGAKATNRHRIGANAPSRWNPQVLRAAALGAAPLVIVLAVLPAAAGKLAAPGSFEAIPDPWQRATEFVATHQGRHRTLLLPGSSFGEYRWGRPLDEPISGIGDATWAVRDLIPLGGNGSTRLLDGIDQAFEVGTLPPGTLPALQRAGIRYLIVRNDLDLVRTDGPRPATVRRVLATEPALQRVASFGPITVDPGTDGRLSATPGEPATQAFREIDVYAVPDPAAPLTSYPAAGTAVVSGGPEGLLHLDPTLLDGRATVLAVDAEAARTAGALQDPIQVATDSARDRDVSFGSIRDNATYTLAAGQLSPTTGAPPLDRWPADSRTGLTSARVDGVAELRENRRRQEPPRPESQPYAAFDGNPDTVWSASAGHVGDWLEVQLDRATDLGSVTVRLPRANGRRIGSVRVTTDQGDRSAVIRPSGQARVPTPAGRTRTVRITITSILGKDRVGPVGLSEVQLGSVQIHRPLVVPSPTPAGADLVSLVRDRQDPFGSVRHDEDGVLDRTVRLRSAGQPQINGTAVAAPGPELVRLLDSAAPSTPATDRTQIRATASSTFRSQPALGPSAALDGDPATAWVSNTETSTPSLWLSWQGEVPVDELTIDAIDAITGPELDPVNRVQVIAGGRTITRPLDATGRITIPSVTTDHLTLRFPDAPGVRAPRQVAVAEVEISALLGRTAAGLDRSAPIHLACGDGPPLTIDGRAVPTRLDTTVGALVDGEPVAWSACTAPRIAAGAHRVTAVAGSTIISTVRISRAATKPVGSARRVTVRTWGREHRTAAVGAGGRTIIATTENVNDGWVATLGGATLRSIRVDGWRQGWVVPAGSAGTLDLRYRPATTQRTGLLVGLLALVLLGMAALLPTRATSRPWAAPLDRTWSAPVVLATCTVVGFAIGGILALLVLPLWLVARRAERLGTAAAAALAGAGAITFTWAGASWGTSTGTFSGPAQALAVAAVLAAGLSLAPDDRSDDPREAERPDRSDHPEVATAQP